MKKSIVALVIGLFSANSMFAEQSAGFMGVGVGRGAMEFTIGDFKSPTFNSTRIPLMAGMKKFINDNLGYRLGIVFDMVATSQKQSGAEIQSGGIDIFADALFNFLSFEKFDLGVFGGVAFGYAGHQQKYWRNYSSIDGDKINGVDLGVNFGLRTNFLENHGVEFYYRMGFLEQKGEFVSGETIKFKRPSQIGVRYIYSFSL